MRNADWNAELILHLGSKQSAIRIPKYWFKMGVLVTDGHWRKTLALVRSLGRKGVRVTVGERTFLNTSFFSKYCSRRLVYPSPRRYPDQFIEFIIKEIKKNQYECLFPMEEETLLLLAKHQSEISKYTYLLIPNLQKIEFVRDKGNLIQFAETHGIPTPKTLYEPPQRPALPTWCRISRVSCLERPYLFQPLSNLGSAPGPLALLM